MNLLDRITQGISINISEILVRSGGLEPPRVLPHSDLNAARLPIPPRPRGLELHSRGSPKAQEGKLRHLKTNAVPPPRHSPGLQVHRSHWVSFDAIDKTERRGDGARLILADGASVPVSRSHMPRLRAKGIV